MTVSSNFVCRLMSFRWTGTPSSRRPILLHFCFVFVFVFQYELTLLGLRLNFVIFYFIFLLFYFFFCEFHLKTF